MLFAATVNALYAERLSPIRERPDRILNWRGVAFGTPYRVRFIVSGSGGFQLTYRSQKGGTLETEGQVP